MKMSNDLSAKYYQNGKERLQKRAPQRYQDLSEEENKKTENMVANGIKIFLKMKNKGLLSKGKTIMKYEKNK